MKVFRAREAHEPISQIVLLTVNEDHKYHYDTGRSQRMNKGLKESR